jgi:hypothetical protein
VRLCDGFYWPISFGVSRAQFGRDAQVCQSSCGSDARLFYQPTNGSAETMVDLSGRSYSQIPNAFRYRKALVPNCTCKPAPWSEAELARHQNYAVEARSKAGPELASAPAVVARPLPGGSAPAASADQRPARTAIVSPETSAIDDLAAGRIALPRPAPVVAERTAEVSLPYPPPRPLQHRMGIGGPPIGSKATHRPSRPVYSHELGQFVFPGDGARDR